MAKLTQETFEEICTYMNDEIREQVHGELDLPFTPEEFLNRYLELDPGFAELLNSEFSHIEL